MASWNMASWVDFCDVRKALGSTVSQANRVRTYWPAAAAAANRYNVDPNLVAGVALVESGWNPRAVSTKGAQGIMQIMPSTAAAMAKVTGIPNQPFTPVHAFGMGAALLGRLLARYHGDVVKALWGYNGGTGNVSKREKAGKPPLEKWVSYAKAVLRAKSRFANARQVCDRTDRQCNPLTSPPDGWLCTPRGAGVFALERSGEAPPKVAEPRPVRPIRPHSPPTTITPKSTAGGIGIGIILLAVAVSFALRGGR